jgi:aldehyde:ferredoxin oxidoreductase
MQKYGTLRGLPAKQNICGANWKNFQECTVPEEMLEILDPTKLLDKFEVARQSFPGCMFGCSRHLRVTEGPYAGLETEAPQMETLLTLQTRLAIEEPTFLLKAHAYCNQMGLDLDAAGGPIGWAMECYQRGILTEKDTDGLKLNWGDADVALELMRKICYREGFGNILAEGCARAADLIGRGSHYYAMHIKGQDLYEPCRGALGWCLGTTTSTRGGGHTTGAVPDQRVVPKDIEKINKIFGTEHPLPQDYRDKAKMVTYMEALHRVNNCLGICHFNTIVNDFDQIDLPHLAEMYAAATGYDVSVKELKWLAMKQLNLEKAFNLRHTNFDRKDDLPTPRDLHEPIPSGKLAGWKIDEDRYNEMLDEYYDLHGWDRETSFPKRETLEAFGLAGVANDLEQIGKVR